MISWIPTIQLTRTDELQLFKNVAIFDFESVCVREDGFTDTETTKWIGKHVPMFVSISSDLLQDPIFICNSNPRNLVSSIEDALDNMTAQSKTQMRMSFLVETAMKCKLSHLMELLNERRGRREATFTFEDECCEAESEGKEESTQIIHMRKKQLM